MGGTAADGGMRQPHRSPNVSLAACPALAQVLARAQHGASDNQETISLGPLLATAIEARADLIAGLGLEVRCAADGPLVTGNPVLLAQLAASPPPGLASCAPPGSSSTRCAAP